MDPCNGAMSYLETISNTEKWLTSPSPSKVICNAWVLILKKVERRTGVLEESVCLGCLKAIEE